MNPRKNVIFVPIITAKREISFRRIFEREFINIDKRFLLEGYPLIIFPEDFDHICYENSPGGGYKKKFSFRRARKILLIKEVCLGNIPYKLIYQDKRENKSICILLEYIEFSIFVVPQPSTEGVFLRLLTVISYGKKVESVIQKQLESGILIKNIFEAVRLRGSTASKKPTDK